MIRLTFVVAAVVAYLISGKNVAAADRDLFSGLAYLRAGAQAQAAQALSRYRNDEPDLEVRRHVDRLLPLLTRPLPEEVREYLATTLEENAQSRSVRMVARRPGYSSRMFPVFP